MSNWQERFWRFVEPVTESGCWIWMGALTHGYGSFSRGKGLSPRAHRASYEMLVGPIPDGLTLDHRCRVRCCVNPSHLRPMTFKENTLIGEGFAAKNLRKIACHRGHGLTEENIYGHVGPSGPRRICRACHRRRDAEYRQRRRDKRAALATHGQDR